MDVGCFLQESAALFWSGLGPEKRVRRGILMFGLHVLGPPMLGSFFMAVPVGHLTTTLHAAHAENDEDSRKAHASGISEEFAHMEAHYGNSLVTGTCRYCPFLLGSVPAALSPRIPPTHASLKPQRVSHGQSFLYR